MFLRSRLTLAATAAGLVTVMFGSAASAAGTPGTPGIGDPYYPNAGNGGYDVSHYNIRLTYNPTTDLLSGTTTISARTTQELSRFDLDFLLPVKSLRVNSYLAQTEQVGDELVVTPPLTLAKNSDITVVVQYEGKPSTVKDSAGFTEWKKTPDGALATDEPDVAPWWYPSSNHPADKATFDVSVAVPTGTEVLSNGTFAGTTPQINGWTRWNWRSAKPQATYLTYIAVGRFEIRTTTTPSGQPLLTAYGDNLGAEAESARASVERTAEVIEFESSVFGEYPFEAQGGVVSTGLSFSLENQTRPVYSSAFFRRGANTSVVSHELSHQWFGDSVSVRDWRDIWLNEGFATYASYLWAESQGEGTAAEIAQYYYDSYPADHPIWQIVVADPGSGNEFNPAVYDRGAMTLQALRNVVGDDNFFTILKTWTAQKKYGNAKIEEFIALSERISGKPLHDLFHTWLFTTGKPASLGSSSSAALSAKVAKTTPKAIASIDLTHEVLASRGRAPLSQ
jgi:aminopeptidase N